MSHRSLGAWFKAKYQQRQARVGTFATATQMRKQGIPLDIALAVLVGRIA